MFCIGLPGQHSYIGSVPALVGKTGPCRRLIADLADDVERLLHVLRGPGTVAVLPSPCNRTVPISQDCRSYEERWGIEATVGHLKDFRRVATRYDKLAPTFLDRATIAAIYASWM